MVKLMTNPNSPAFPLEPQWKYSALTKREYFAAIALQGVIACETENWNTTNEQNARTAVRLADALIEALNYKD